MGCRRPPCRPLPRPPPPRSRSPQRHRSRGLDARPRGVSFHRSTGSRRARLEVRRCEFVGKTLALLARHPLPMIRRSPRATTSRGHWRRGRYPPRPSRDDVLREPASRPSRRDDLLARISRASGLIPRPARPGSPRRDPPPPPGDRPAPLVAVGCRRAEPPRGCDACRRPRPNGHRPTLPGPLDHARHRDAVLSQLPPGKLVYVPAGKARRRERRRGKREVPPGAGFSPPDGRRGARVPRAVRHRRRRAVRAHRAEARPGDGRVVRQAGVEG